MLIKRPKGWELPESAATPEHVFMNRRTFLAGSLAASGGIGLNAVGFPGSSRAEADPTADLYPAARSDKYMVNRALTSEEAVTSYNNFYEFGTSKDIAEAAQALPLRPWQVKIDGMVEKEIVLDIDDLIRRMTLEERVYRFRCVEAWAMTVPWTGFPMRKLVDLAAPLSGARYVRMETFLDPDISRAQSYGFGYPWPYVEGLTMEEARNDLTLMVIGVYGQPAPPQNGAPIRLMTPWKYGFKSIKSIVRFTFTDERPVSFWEEIQAREYGFWANVNPEVSHPRWSQAQERIIDDGPSILWDKVPTQLYNGYGEFVASMYDGLEGENLFM